MLHILVGPAAAGKSSLAALVPKSKRLRSITTRPSRPGEGYLDYYFADDEQFDAYLQDGELCMIREYDPHGTVWRYAFFKREVDHAAASKRDYLTILDPHGAEECVLRYGADRVRVYYLIANPAECTKRMFGRGDEAVKIGERLNRDYEDFHDLYLSWVVDPREEL